MSNSLSDRLKLPAAVDQDTVNKLYLSASETQVRTVEILSLPLSLSLSLSLTHTHTDVEHVCFTVAAAESQADQ